MKKFLLILFGLMFFVSSSDAETLKARTVQAFSTENPTSTMELVVISNDFKIGDIEIPKGYCLYGDVIDLISPQPWGKNATFSLKIKAYKDLSGVVSELKEKPTLKYKQVPRPQFDRSEISFMGSTDGGRTETGFTFSPYDIKLMKESKSFGEYLWKDATKDSMWQKGWELKYKSNEVIYFKY